MRIINAQEIRYDLNNENEKKYHDQFQKYRDCVDNYKLGKITYDDALFYLKDALNKHEKKIPAGEKLKDGELFGAMYNSTRTNQIRGFIEEIEAIKKKKPAPSGIDAELLEECANEGYLNPDRIRIAKKSSLDKLAEFLYTRVENLSPDMLSHFRKKDGKEYSENSRNEAVKRARPPKI